MADAERIRISDRYGLTTPTVESRRTRREIDLYIALVSELFDRLGAPDTEARDWSGLGEALADFGSDHEGALAADAAIFAAMSYYMGGFPAAAALTLKGGPALELSAPVAAAWELLARPGEPQSPRTRELIEAIRTGDLAPIGQQIQTTPDRLAEALATGPDEWVGEKLFEMALKRFAETNLRAVLPPMGDGFWSPLVSSFISQSPPIWDYFPSQIAAIEGGLLSSDSTYSLQMPTGSGKTALTETLLFSHLVSRPGDAAVVIVPFRALASELRTSLVSRFNQMGIAARSIYGGSIPTAAEMHSLEEVRALVATPEALSGILSADPQFVERMSLVVCDEGHLLDNEGRGVSLELLLARTKALHGRSPRFVFLSAIVPNIEQINAWLGGSDESVIRSSYQPSSVEYSRLESRGSGVQTKIDLAFRTPGQEEFELSEFISQADFQHVSRETNRTRTFGFTTFKTQAVATARKALPSGTVALFAANKRGNQGCVGLAQELLDQLEADLPLPLPIETTEDHDRVDAAAEYLRLEYGSSWLGTELLRAGAIVHHGDIPQETREVLEALLRAGAIKLAFCTNTLAEGVNLPIRTMILYSLRRRGPRGEIQELLTRDIKNLVGRAGRAGSTTKGMVVCVNPTDWPRVEQVSRGERDEPVKGALFSLVNRLREAILRQRGVVSNEDLESTTALHPLIDGIDAVLMDIATEEMDPDELVALARSLADETYAADELDGDGKETLERVFALRAQRISGLKQRNRLSWVRESGAHARLLESVEDDLARRSDDWAGFRESSDEALIELLVSWAWNQESVREATRAAFGERDDLEGSLASLVLLWIRGHSVASIAERLELEVDEVLAAHSSVISHELITLLEQGVSLLERVCLELGNELSEAVIMFPESLRFGVPDYESRELARTLRHRRAAVELGKATVASEAYVDGQDSALETARGLLDDRANWIERLGTLVFSNSRQDLSLE